MANKSFLSLLITFFSLVASGAYSEITFKILNNCQRSLWLASSPSDDDPNPENGPGTLEILTMSDPWKGSIWAPTKCSYNTSYYFSCETGDCRTGAVLCLGPHPSYPVTQLNFDINQGVVQYEVSLIHGHNIAVRIEEHGGSLVGGGSCPVVDCVGAIRNVCPSFLIATNKDGGYVGCHSACDRIGNCAPNFTYTQYFKQLCGTAHVYPGDNNPPLYSCSGATSYNITFCPS